jgi:hypothetical protein
MPRALAFVPALLALTASASSETALNPAGSQAGLLFATSHSDNRLSQSSGVHRSEHPMHAFFACCKTCSVAEAFRDT